MKYVKMLGLAAVAAMAMMAFAASSASATTSLEVGGVQQTGSVTLTASLKSGTSAVLKDTAGFSQNTCTESLAAGASEAPFTGGESVTGSFYGHKDGKADEEGLKFGSCTRTVKVHNSGTLVVTSIASTTNGTVSSKEAEVTVGSAIGTLVCKTGAGTHLGTLTGVKEGTATMDINAVINCGIIPSAKWEGTYSVTSPTGLGVRS